MTTTRERKRPVQRTAKPKRKRTPTRRAAATPSRGTDVGYGLTLNSEYSERFMARPLSERRQIIEGFKDYVRRALDGMTMEEFLAERRREADRDNA